MIRHVWRISIAVLTLCVAVALGVLQSTSSSVDSDLPYSLLSDEEALLVEGGCDNEAYKSNNSGSCSGSQATKGIPPGPSDTCKDKVHRSADVDGHNCVSISGCLYTGNDGCVKHCIHDPQGDMYPMGFDWKYTCKCRGDAMAPGRNKCYENSRGDYEVIVTWCKCQRFWLKWGCVAYKEYCGANTDCIDGSGSDTCN